jgi:molecular chaperone GrpE
MSKKEKEEKISEETKVDEEKTDSTEETKTEDKLNQQLSFLQAENEKLKKEEESWKNKYYEAFADLANTRKSLEKDHQQMVKYRASSFIEKIIPALDSFNMAFKVDIQDPVAKNFAIGFKMILNQIEQAMQEEGVTFIEPKKGDKFDESCMHAIQTCDGEEDGLVSDVMSRGYKLHDRLLRPSMVVVTKKKVEEVSKDEDAKASN